MRAETESLKRECSPRIFLVLGFLAVIFFVPLTLQQENSFQPQMIGQVGVSGLNFFNSTNTLIVDSASGRLNLTVGKIFYSVTSPISISGSVSPSVKVLSQLLEKKIKWSLNFTVPKIAGNTVSGMFGINISFSPNVTVLNSTHATLGDLYLDFSDLDGFNYSLKENGIDIWSAFTSGQNFYFDPTIGQSLGTHDNIQEINMFARNSSNHLYAVLVRDGNVMNIFRSIDGITWTNISTVGGVSLSNYGIALDDSNRLWISYRDTIGANLTIFDVSSDSYVLSARAYIPGGYVFAPLTNGTTSLLIGNTGTQNTNNNSNYQLWNSTTNMTPETTVPGIIGSSYLSGVVSDNNIAYMLFANSSSASLTGFTYVNYSFNSDSWSTSIQLATNPSTIRHPYLAISGNKSLLAVMMMEGASSTQFYRYSYNIGIGWSTVTNISAIGDLSDNNNNARLIYSNHTGLFYLIFVNSTSGSSTKRIAYSSFDMATGVWSSVTMLEANFSSRVSVFYQDVPRLGNNWTSIYYAFALSNSNPTSINSSSFLINSAPSIVFGQHSPISPAIYSSGAIYRFNATINDVNGVADISTVLFEDNRTGTLVNRTVSTSSDVNTTARNYTITIDDLGVGTLSIRFYANDTLNKFASTSQDTHIINKATNPIRFSSNATNTSVYNVKEVVLFSSLWTIQQDVNLSYYIFSWNESASWVNDTALAFSSVNNSWSNITKTLLYENRTVGWRVYSNSTSGANYSVSWNNTGISTFTTAGEDPSISSITYIPSCLENGSAITISYSQSDNNYIEESWCEFSDPGADRVGNSTATNASSTQCNRALDETGDWSIKIMNRDPANNTRSSSFAVNVRASGQCSSEPTPGGGGGGGITEVIVEVPVCPEGQRYVVELKRCEIIPVPTPAGEAESWLVSPIVVNNQELRVGNVPVSPVTIGLGVAVASYLGVFKARARLLSKLGKVNPLNTRRTKYKSR